MKALFGRSSFLRVTRGAHRRVAAWQLCALAAFCLPAGAAELQAYAGAVGGIASGTGPFACATSGPTIGSG
ncbi:MAG: hypothetical protein EOP02_22630, partial [Proteobacteria bacterium]